MKFYLVTANSSGVGSNAAVLATQGECATERKRLLGLGHARKNITTEDLDVPTDKAGLRAWLESQFEEVTPFAAAVIKVHGQNT